MQYILLHRGCILVVYSWILLRRGCILLIYSIYAVCAVSGWAGKATQILRISPGEGKVTHGGPTSNIARLSEIKIT